MSGEGFQQGTPALFHEDILHGAPKSSALRSLANNVSVVQLTIFLATELWRDWQLLSLPSDTEKLFVCSALSVPGECCQEAVSATG